MKQNKHYAFNDTDLLILELISERKGITATNIYKEYDAQAPYISKRLSYLEDRVFIIKKLVGRNNLLFLTKKGFNFIKLFRLVVSMYNGKS